MNNASYMREHLIQVFKVFKYFKYFNDKFFLKISSILMYKLINISPYLMHLES